MKINHIEFDFNYLLLAAILHFLFLIEQSFDRFVEYVVLTFHYHLLTFAFVFHRPLEKCQKKTKFCFNKKKNFFLTNLIFFLMLLFDVE